MKDVYNWTNKEKEDVKKVISEVKDVLNIQSWTIYSDFVDGKIEPTVHKDGGLFITDAEGSVTFEYEKLVVKWYPPLLRDIRLYGLKNARDTIVHELTHCLVEELYNIASRRYTTDSELIDATERLTQRITKIVCTKILDERK